MWKLVIEEYWLHMNESMKTYKKKSLIKELYILMGRSTGLEPAHARATI